MKKIKTLALGFIFVTTMLTAQDNCSKYYPMVEGTSFEYTSMNKKGKTEGVINYVISEVSNDGPMTKATFDIKYTDEKGKEVFHHTYDISCDGNVVKIDYQSLFPSQMMQQYEDMDVEMEISGTDIELPNNLSVGQELADANVAVTMNMGAMKMKMNVDTTNRKVEAKETVTTPAGTYECYVITEDSKSKAMMVNQEFSNRLWLAEGVGMVKQETYKKNGNLMSSTELTKFSQ